MDNIKLYEVSPAYIDYLAPHAPHLFRNKQPGQRNERKYIGVVLAINGVDYFAPPLILQREAPQDAGRA